KNRTETGASNRYRYRYGCGFFGCLSKFPIFNLVVFADKLVVMIASRVLFISTTTTTPRG
ncbi:MAG: hypothetical protein V4760_19155, partial [Bdellovibrionota bacterium]